MARVMRLFCLPYAGGRAAIFGQWQAVMPPGVEVCPLDFPGHGQRAAEPLRHDAAAIVSDLAAVVASRLDLPFAVFGHSMGAMIAFDLVRELQARSGQRPCVLYVSGRRAPHIPLPHAPWYGLPRTEFFARWRTLSGASPGLFDHPRVRAAIEPILRADSQVVQTYRLVRGSRVACPIVAFGAVDDRHCIQDEIDEWRHHTDGGFSLHMLRGGHFFIETNRRQFLSILSETLMAPLSMLGES